MRYEVVLIKSDEGYAVHCPALPACWSQGRTQDEALANIRDAISVYLDYVSEKLPFERSDWYKKANAKVSHKL